MFAAGRPVMLADGSLFENVVDYVIDFNGAYFLNVLIQPGTDRCRSAYLNHTAIN
jgi:uncharacterized protein YrrD